MSLREINLFHTSMEERQAALAMNCAGSVEDDIYLVLGTLTYFVSLFAANGYLSDESLFCRSSYQCRLYIFPGQDGRGWSSYVLRLISPTRQHRDEHNRIDVTFCIVTSHDRVPRVNALSSSDVVIASYQNDPNQFLLPHGFLWSIVPSLLDRRATPLFESDRGARGGSPCKRKIKELHKQLQ